MLCAIIFAIAFINSAKAYGFFGPDLSHLNGLGNQIRQQVQDSLRASGIGPRHVLKRPVGFLNDEYDPFSPGFLGGFKQQMKKMNTDLAIMGALLEMQNGASGVTLANFNDQQILIRESTQYECQGTIIKPTSAGNVPECKGTLKPVRSPCLPISNRISFNDVTCIGNNIQVYTVNGRTTCVGGELYSNNDLTKMCGDPSKLIFEYYPSSGHSISPMVTCLNPGQFYCTFNSRNIPFLNN